MKDENDIKTAELLPTDMQRRGVGRPKKYESAAERQKAYRQRLKQQGKRVVSKVVRDVRDDTKPLISDVLDLSEVRGARGV
ncbi:MAG: hypothetical protein PHX60_15395 [Giesbergeria sp.]|uniref:hypothetical protein n=1 Tax=Giesbergeria sp. TaxID=2818473 RepID=UPI0026377289|nr:hypothetical protein [Giesbergeria sp.]MDD2611037.1 hypothetical protein [Giesbergeria sp.]